jgi:Ca-activated chloride channel homolog
MPVALDERTLRDIARISGGDYHYAAEAGDLTQIYAGLGSTISWVEERTELTALASGLGALFLAAAGGLSLRWFQRLP